MYKPYDEAFPDLIKQIVASTWFNLRMEISRATESGVLDLMRLFAVSTSQGESPIQPKKYDYGNVLFMHFTVDADELKRMFTLINLGEDISLIGFSERKPIGTQQLRAQCNQIQYNHINSRQFYSYRQLPFPYHLFQIPSKTEDANELHMPLGGKGLAYFLTKIQAQAYYLRGHIASDSTQRVDSCIEVVIEDARGRFVEVSVHNSRIEFELDGNALDACEIKLTGTNPALVESVSALDAQKDGVEFSELPRDLHVILMQEADVIDQRFISRQSSPFNLTQGVVFMERQEEASLEKHLLDPLGGSERYEDSGSELIEFHPVVQKVAGHLYDDGHYRQAVLDTYIALVQKVKEVSGRMDLDGTKLMQSVFSPKDPKIRLSTDPDEQLGFMWLFCGAVMAVRNPRAHKLDSALDRQQAKEWLGFASVLLRLLDGTQSESPTHS